MTPAKYLQHSQVCYRLLYKVTKLSELKLNCKEYLIFK